MFWLFGIKQELENLKKEVKQVKCKHPAEKNIFVEDRYLVPGLAGVHRERKCSECGTVLEAFPSEIDICVARWKWHEEEAKRLDIDRLLGTEYLRKVEEKNTAANGVSYRNPISAAMSASELVFAEYEKQYLAKKKKDSLYELHRQMGIDALKNGEIINYMYLCEKYSAANNKGPESTIKQEGMGEETLKKMQELVAAITVVDGDFIKKTKGRWIHERSGKVLKVKK